MRTVTLRQVADRENASLSSLSSSDFVYILARHPANGSPLTDRFKHLIKKTIFVFLVFFTRSLI